ncbi:MAG: hypothetical protein HY918_03645 [Candidatus Doudnabacteria bacterium]|nr:hypothetical protein [Candidatus Doudnabacteria bacterium]
MNKSRVYFGFFLVVFVAIIVAIVLQKIQPAPAENKVEIQTFEQCVRAGNPVMESYPRQCSLPSGKFFVEKIEDKQCTSNKDCSSGLACLDGQCRQLKVKGN